MSEFVYCDGELHHYGVLGMKWGVRRGRSGRAYEKASKKLRKLDAKVDKSLEKARVKRTAADRKMDSMFSTTKGIAKAERKAQKAMRKAVVKANKGRKWVKAMEKTFDNTDVSLSKEQINLGKKYIELLDKRTFR